MKKERTKPLLIILNKNPAVAVLSSFIEPALTGGLLVDYYWASNINASMHAITKDRIPLIYL